MVLKIVYRLQAIKLRGFASRNKFYKGNETHKLPEFFHVGHEVGGSIGSNGRIAVGGGNESQAFGTSNNKKKKGKSLLSQLLGNEDTKSWVHSKNASHMSSKEKVWGTGVRKNKARKKVNHKKTGSLR